MISIFILDDQIVARQGLKHILREEFRDLRFGEASDATEAWAGFEKRRWDIAVLDAGLSDRDGLDVLGELRRRQPECRVMVLSDKGARGLTARVLQSGAWAFVSKSASRQELVRAFAQVLAGKKVLPRDLAAERSASPAPPSRKLSAREHSVLAAVASGKGSGEIAAEMNVSVQTISTYRRRIREKLGLKSTADIVRYVLEHRIPEKSLPSPYGAEGSGGDRLT